ncbi:MAG TPA: hypothetical protein DDW27_04730, partial [Bacteroidales bacterium]|nr:hypothetical protein [Bacteroidales bacterium]
DFTGQAGRKTARELGVQGFIQQCNEKRGQLTGSDINIPEPEIIKKSEASTGKDPAVQAEEVTVKKEPSVYRPQEADSFVKARDSVKPETVRVSEISQQKETMETEPEKTLADSTFEAIFDEHLTEAVRQPSASGVLMLFSADPKPFYDPGEKIRINPDHPPGLIYRIQVAVFRNQVEPSYFKGISPVYGIRNASSGLTTYYAGMFRKNDDAKKALPQVRQKGFKDAFIVAFSGGKPVSPERAAILEKEWGVIPFRPDERIIEELQADTIPPTLSFRVEVIRSKKPVSEQNYDELKKLAGARGLDIKTIPDGNIVYLIGQFITYESAGSYADLLVRNGYRDAKVVAWLGKREIPVETAKQLFRSLE